MAFFSKSVICVWDIFCILDYPSQSSFVLILISNTAQGNRQCLDDMLQRWVLALTKHSLKCVGSWILSNIPLIIKFSLTAGDTFYTECECLECGEGTPSTTGTIVGKTTVDFEECCHFGRELYP